MALIRPHLCESPPEVKLRGNFFGKSNRTDLSAKGEERTHMQDPVSSPEILT